MKFRFVLYLTLVIIMNAVTFLSCISQINPGSILNSKNFVPDDGTDPSKPVSKISLKNSYFVDWKEYISNRYFNVASLSGEVAFLSNKLSLRIELPFALTNVTSNTSSGAGDISSEAKYVFTDRNVYSMFTSLGISIPTASEKELGFEKFILYPSVGTIWKLRKGFTGFILTYYKSINGKDNSQSFANDRGDTITKSVNEIALIPQLKYNFTESFYTYIKPDVRYNFESSKIFIPMTVEFGNFFRPNWVTTLSGSFHISNRDRRYDVNIILGVNYLF